MSTSGRNNMYDIEDKQIADALNIIVKAVGDNVSWYSIINALLCNKVIDNETHKKWFNICDRYRIK